MMKVLLISIFLTFSLFSISYSSEIVLPDYSDYRIYIRSDRKVHDFYDNPSFGSLTGLTGRHSDSVLFSQSDGTSYSRFFEYWYNKNNTELLAKNQLEIYTKLQSVENRIAQMDPTIITKSISFLVGAFAAIAFVLSSNSRY